MVVWSTSVDATILLTFLLAPACTACTDMVYEGGGEVQYVMKTHS